ncbi:MAG: MFS transporter [Phycisphaerae bacterium]|nr:MFS transporter [Phycisphaerae bacterium]
MINKPNSKAQSRWVDFPFAPGKWRFFYGWFIVLVATIGIIASIPGQTIGVGVFTDSFIEILGLTRNQLSLAYMYGTVISSFLLPLAGTVTDKVGTRVMVVISSIGLGISLVVLSLADHIPAITANITATIMLMAFGFLLIRFFGQGCLTMVSRITIAKWFNHRRGLATGIANIAVAYSFNASPALLNYFVENWGWQSSYLLLAAIVGIGMSVIGWLFYRDNPEQCGLVMDGRDDQLWVKKAQKRVPQIYHEFTRSEAIRTWAFWAFALACAWQALYMTALSFHITSLGQELGLSRSQSYAVFPVIGLVSVAVALIAGWLSDHIRLKWLLIVNVIFQIVTAAGQLDFSTTSGRILFIAGYGVSGGIFGLMMTIIWPRYFGRKHLGSISGLTTSILVFSSAIGPIFFSKMYDVTGSYKLVALISMAVPALLLIPSFLVKNPQEKLRETV